MITERKSITEIAGLWKEDKKAFVKVSTYSAYLLILQNHILPYFGEMTDVREADVQAFAMKKLQDGLCQKSIKDILVVLKMIVRFGAKNGWCDYVEWDIRFPTVQEKPQLDVLSVQSPPRGRRPAPAPLAPRRPRAASWRAAFCSCGSDAR